jgi:hypothetical protein
MVSPRSTRTVRLGMAAMAAAVFSVFSGISAPLAGAAERPAGSPAEALKARKGKDEPGIRGHGFVRDASGTFTTIDVPGATRFTLALGTNEAGQTVGAYVDRKGRLHGFCATAAAPSLASITPEPGPP